MDPPRGASSEGVTRVHDYVGDLVGLMARRAQWTGEPADVVGTLLDTLISALRLAFVCARLNGEDGGAPLEIMRVADSVTATSSGDDDLSFACSCLGLRNEIGIVVAGSRRPDFPAHTEKLLLDVAANQATIGLQQARLLRAQKEVADHRRIEEARRERESHLVIDTIPGLVAILTPAGEVAAVNDQLVRYCGQPLEEMKQWGTNGTVHPDDLPQVAQVFTQAIAAGDPYDFEARIRRFDGVYHWFQIRGLPLRDMGIHISRWYVLLTDIDDMKRTGDALRNSEREFRLLVETIPALVWRGTPEGELDYLNARAVEYLGFTAESLTGGRWLELVHPDHRDAVVRRWLESATTGSSYEDIYRLRRADGHYRWIRSVGQPFHDGEGRIAHWYGLVIDIEDRKRVEDDLRRSEAFLVEGQHLARIGNFSWRIEAEDITWSEQIYRMFEFAPGTRMTLELMGTRVHPEDRPMLLDMVERARRGVSDFEYEHRLLMPDDSIKYLHLIAHRTKDEQGRLEYIGAVQDVTDRKVAEDALNKARSELAHVARVTTLSALTASIAHEVNQPLSGIITNAGTCLRMLDAAPPNIDGARETARRTIRDGNRAADVIARLRALFIRKEFTLEPLDLNDATREVLTLSSTDLQRQRVVLQSDLAGDLPTITGDRIQLQQVILNLLRNASDAMLGVDDRPRHLLISTQREAGDRVRLTVRDAGVGLDPDAMDKLFDAFYTTKSDGMGIGLSISRSIIERHQGRLWAEPNDGPGATFSFSIPREADVIRGVR